MGFLTAGGHDFQNVLHGCNGIFRRPAADDDANFACSNRYLAGRSGMLRHAYGFRGLKESPWDQAAAPNRPFSHAGASDLVMSTSHADRKCVDIRERHPPLARVFRARIAHQQRRRHCDSGHGRNPNHLGSGRLALLVATFAGQCGFSALVAGLVLAVIFARADATGAGGPASLNAERMLRQGSGS